MYGVLCLYTLLQFTERSPALHLLFDLPRLICGRNVLQYAEQRRSHRAEIMNSWQLNSNTTSATKSRTSPLSLLTAPPYVMYLRKLQL